MPPRFPKPSEISAALAALGVYAQAPSERELAEHAIAAGGERVLAAALANALYGAAIGCGMLAEGHMLEQGDNRAERLSRARPGAQGFRRGGRRVRRRDALASGPHRRAAAGAQRR